jgi:hypothetical protein
VLDTSPHDEELAGLEVHGPVAQVKIHLTFEDQEKLILVLVRMPDIFTLELHQLYVLPVQLPGDPGYPEVIDQIEFFSQVYLL